MPNEITLPVVDINRKDNRLLAGKVTGPSSTRTHGLFYLRIGGTNDTIYLKATELQALVDLGQTVLDEYKPEPHHDTVKLVDHAGDSWVIEPDGRFRYGIQKEHFADIVSMFGPVTQYRKVFKFEKIED